MSVVNKQLLFLLILFMCAICLSDIPASVRLDPETLQKEAVIMKTPVKYSLREYIIGADKRSREGLEGDVIRIPFHVENTLNLSHPGIFVKGGIPLPKGVVKGECSFQVLDNNNLTISAQVNKTAYWPDGSLKWVLVIMSTPQKAKSKQQYMLEIRKNHTHNLTERISVRETALEIQVNTGAVEFTINKKSSDLFESMSLIKEGKHVPVLRPNNHSTLFAEIERRSRAESKKITFRADENSAVLEEAGSERVVICIKGTHFSKSGETFGPFTLRIYAHVGSGLLRFVHSFVYTGDPNRDFLKAIGFRMQTSFPQVKTFSLGGERDTGHKIDYNIDTNLPVWRTALLSQTGSESYSIRKWIDPMINSAVKMEEGGRSQGWGSIASSDVSVAIGVKNFRQEYPKAILIDAEKQQITAYFYSPYAEALDLRRYSDVTYSELYETSQSGPEPAPIGPESDWEGRLTSDDMGARYIGKTSEFFLDISDGKDSYRSSRQALFLQNPPLLTTNPEWIAKTRVFGDFAPLSDDFIKKHGRPLKETSDFLIHEQGFRKWYSFLDYGDMVHSYDPGRDIWRRDEGGYAWNNNEHCTCEGLWTAYIHSGDVRVFRLAEAMTRHIGDVDMYHMGPLMGNGTRHNVNHYGCNCKKRRMTLPENKRMHYYFTGDEHTRDLIHFVYRSFSVNKIEQEGMRKGRNTMDLGVYASALLFLWETTQGPKYGRMFRNTAETLCSFRINGRGIRRHLKFDLETGKGSPPDRGGYVAQTKSFLLKFGPMDLLINAAELTQSEKIHSAILEWAEILHLPEDAARKYQAKFRAGIDSGKAVAYAYKYTKDPRYLKYMKAWLDKPPVWFETVGEPGSIFNEPHVIPRNGERGTPVGSAGEEKFQLRDMADLFRNSPYCYYTIDAD